MKRLSRNIRRDIRHVRIRRNLTGTAEKPRLSVFKSAKHFYAQVIDDSKAHTLISVSTLTPEIRETLVSEKGKKTDAAKIVGKLLGELCVSSGVKQVCFDRGGYPYHGRVKAFADAAREAGLEF